MKRVIELWDICHATRTPTHLRLEKVLSTKNPHLPDGFIEVVLSTSHWGDVEKFNGGCTANLMLKGETEQVLANVEIVSQIYCKEGRYVFTVTAEHWI